MEQTLNHLTNLTVPNNYYYTPIQLKLPLILNEIIKTDDPVYTFDEVMKGIDLKKYLVSKRTESRGRIGYNPITMLKVVLFAFQLKGYASTREIEDLCYNDIRFRWLLQYENNFPTHMTIANFINKNLKKNIDIIFSEINRYIFEKDKVDTEHIYIDGTKIEANANKYSWVWKKACITNRNKLFIKITQLLHKINLDLALESVQYSINDIYEIDYIQSLLKDYAKRYQVDEKSFVYGRGNHQSIIQKRYESLKEYLLKLYEYANKIETCGEHRNSYSKTDKDATFMRIKTDYMGNDQLLPAYNIQFGICDEYIAVTDINQFASDANCFIPLMEKFNHIYHKYPTYPIGDAGYGTYNNYLFCEVNGIEKFMKFAMYKKETEDKKYHSNPFRPVNFKIDNEGNLICPNNKKFKFLYNRPVKGNNYGRTEEIYECEDCLNCPFKSKCTKSVHNRQIHLNQELTSFHREVIENLNSVHGCLLRMNRSIQAEGAFGIIKQDRFYRRIVRKGLTQVRLEVNIIACAYNIYKYHNKLHRNLN